MSSFFDLFRPKKKREVKVLLLGLDNAGKSTILKVLKGEKVTNLPPTKGFNFQKIEYNKVSFVVWDLGGQKAIRQYWEDYYQKDNDVLIYVIDSSDNYRLDETGKELYNILQQPELNGMPLLIYANKQDLNLALSADEILSELNLDKINDRNWTIIACSALTKEGINEGLDWIIKVTENNNS